MSFRSAGTAALAAAALFAVLALAGCAQRAARLEFRAREGRPQALRRDRDGRYLLRRGLGVGPAGLTLYLRYRGDPERGELVVYAPPDASRGRGAGDVSAETRAQVIARRVLPEAPPGLEVVAHLPLPAGSVVAGFAVRAPGQELRLLEAGLGPGPSGLRREPGLLRFGPEVALLRESEAGLELHLEPAEPVSLELRYVLLPAASWADLRRLEDEGRPPDRPARVQARLLLEGEGQARELRHAGLAGERRLDLPAALTGFAPRRLLLRSEAGGSLRLEALELRRAAGPEGPIAADPGAVLLYPQERWRSPQYELFAWSRFPEVLIMDTASYAVQSRFFKRLAFFVEKSGYRGRLLADEEFSALHGYNAHDYRAEDLARFFNAARAEGFPLNEEERLLARLLVANGVLREAGGYQPGRGAILSISRSSSAVLRRHLLAHECYHGLYFLLPEYRREAQGRWQALGSAERSFWELFFRWVGYDTGDEYLAANEYQAYLFQQERGSVDAYFRDLTAPRLAARYPQAAASIRALLDASPDLFTAGFDGLEPALVRRAGLEGGRAIELLPVGAGR